MLQRIQTLYLLAAAALCFACLCLPVGVLTDGETAETAATMFNMWVSMEPDHAHVFTPWALFVLLVLVTLGYGTAIGLYRHRPVQGRLVMLCNLFVVGWYIVYALLIANFDYDFMPTLWAGFPAVACICGYLAFRGIIRDEALVRSLDRLR